MKGEKLRNPRTGEAENPDERMMREVEGLLAVRAKTEDHRRGLISTIAAWAIDHPGQKIVNAVVFPQQMKRLRETVFTERRKGVAPRARSGEHPARAGAARARRRGAPGGWAELHEEQRKNALVAPRGSRPWATASGARSTPAARSSARATPSS